MFLLLLYPEASSVCRIWKISVCLTMHFTHARCLEWECRWNVTNCTRRTRPIRRALGVSGRTGDAAALPGGHVTPWPAAVLQRGRWGWTVSHSLLKNTHQCQQFRKRSSQLRQSGSNHPDRLLLLWLFSPFESSWYILNLLELLHLSLIPHPIHLQQNTFFISLILI